ncbi:hypothetical protein KIN20_032930 [Parelaphostrongylus tenuis]|uniref:Uncharacterized protein n=1 Tax=Parelaphostrongylus tenuis TaxID=148309 RepID=A0AAD5WHU6_PARTN|nr:hypothetical protein KIN20_032930 [Parelaphostrongylus tenuis]
MAKLFREFFMIPLLATVSTVLGCGLLPAGQGRERKIVILPEFGKLLNPILARSRTFNVTGLTTLPVAMVYSTAPDVQAQIPGISPSEGSAQAFVLRIVMQTVFNVLERQASSALLPDAVISAILSQLVVKITYTPLQCQNLLVLQQWKTVSRHYWTFIRKTASRCITPSENRMLVFIENKQN